MKEQKPSKVWEVLSKEYRYESLILVFFAIVLMIVSAYILNGTLTLRTDIPVLGLLGLYPLVSASVFFVAGFVGLIVGAWPIFKPSFKEVKRLTPPTRKIFIDHIIKVFTFILGLTAIFLIYDTIITQLFSLAM